MTVSMMDAREYTFIKRQVFNLTGLNLDCYKAPQVQRRLKTYLVRSGHSDWHRFFCTISGDSVEVSKFKDYLTINVSSFFRDMERFEYLQRTILPELMRLVSPQRSALRMWSAGCSQGYEPYSLAMMLAEVTGLYRQHYILATDIDHSALEQGEAGGPYSADQVAKTPSHLINRYFSCQAADVYYVIESIKRQVTFRHHNLLADRFESGFDLIVCRNVVIYFTAEVKSRLYRQFYEALRPGGMLFVGGTEVVFKPADLGFEAAGISFYRRKK
ncbi:MAG: protein-glutamate O-methyltransferase CheR [Chloroflexi bacterium]|nr:protein-glutamate O-methyltransferase CheR [Chloroflexota bacterium]